MERIATPLVGGILSSTVLTLVLSPAVYSLWKGRELALRAARAEGDRIADAPGPEHLGPTPAHG